MSIAGAVVHAGEGGGLDMEDDADVDEVIPEEAKKKHNVEAVFKRYDEDGSESLDP